MNLSKLLKAFAQINFYD